MKAIFSIVVTVLLVALLGQALSAQYEVELDDPIQASYVDARMQTRDWVSYQQLALIDDGWISGTALNSIVDVTETVDQDGTCLLLIVFNTGKTDFFQRRAVYKEIQQAFPYSINLASIRLSTIGLVLPYEKVFDLKTLILRRFAKKL